jgi:hypothetical protein
MGHYTTCIAGAAPCRLARIGGTVSVDHDRPASHLRNCQFAARHCCRGIAVHIRRDVRQVAVRVHLVRLAMSAVTLDDAGGVEVTARHHARHFLAVLYTDATIRIFVNMKGVASGR